MYSVYIGLKFTDSYKKGVIGKKERERGIGFQIIYIIYYICIKDCTHCRKKETRLEYLGKYSLEIKKTCIKYHQQTNIILQT